jgi:glyoxylase-like metal-dependent hydrolase (beta-lactamase superfamily II)
MTTTDRRSVLKASLGGLAGLASLPLVGGLAGCSRQASKLPFEALGDRISIITGAPGNVIVLSTGDGFLLVDSGSAELARSVQASLEGGRVHTLFNTHYHADQTGGNALFGEEGAAIHAHAITRQWLATDYYVPAEDRWVAALPEAAWPAETFRQQGTLTAGAESIEYGYLLEAHTRGDSYVYFRDSNILAVGDVVSPLRDPALDWYAGGWLGGRVEAMDDLLELANAETRIVPAYGPVMSYAELQAERDMMWHLWERTSDLVNQGRSAQDLLEAGVMDEIDRKFEDPYRFLYDVAKGLWAHYTNFGGNVV